MDKLKSLLYRLRYAYHMRRLTASSWSFALDSAAAGDIDFDVTPREAVNDELGYWDDDGDG